METLKDLWQYMKKRKALWIAPILIALLLLGAMLFLAASPAASPFIYTLF
ncbi:MAG: DUF5989 family protein [Elusimicrobiota bacterium]